MKSFVSPSEELSGILTELAEDALSSEGMTRLGQLLADPSERAAYVDYMATDALLRWRFATPQELADDSPADLAIISDLETLGEDDDDAHDAAARTSDRSLLDKTLDKNAAVFGLRPPLSEDYESEDEPIPLAPPASEILSTNRSKPFARWLGLLSGRRWGAAAAMILLAGVLLLILHSVGLLGGNSGEAIAMGRSLDAVWLDPNSARALGSNIPIGEAQDLTSGFVELTSPNGLTIIVQGPANFTVQKPGVLTLGSGRLTARVPEKAHGFTVNTPVGNIVDLGTEFGVTVNSAGETDVQTFRGQIAVTPAIASADSKAKSLVVAGAAKRIDTAGNVKEIAPDTSVFIRPQQFEGWAALPKDTSYQRWSGYSQRLRFDPDLVAYYTFDNAAEAPKFLLNRSHWGGELDGVLGVDIQPTDARGPPAAAPVISKSSSWPNSPSWTTGRWPQKGALAFDPQNRSRIRLAGIADDPSDFSAGGKTAKPFTIAAWICPVHPGSIISKGEALAEQYAIDIDPSGQLRAWIRNPGSDPDHPVAVTGSSVTLGGDKWLHVAMTYDPSARSVRLYVDGAVVGEEIAPGGILMPTAEPIRIGAHLTPINALAVSKIHSRFLGDLESSTFGGRIDELSIFRRALSADQVKEMYESGRPD